MNKLLTAGLTLIFLVMFTTPAMADHDQDYYYDQGAYTGSRWNEAANETYCLQGFDNKLSSSTYANMKNTTIDRVTYIENTTQIDTNWSIQNPIEECANSYSYTEWSDGAPDDRCFLFAEHLPNVTSRISYSDLPQGTLGETMTCDIDNNGYIDFFWIAINSCFHDPNPCSFDLHFNVETAVPQGDYDFAGLLVHEFVHATGFHGHFPHDTDACPDSSSNNTMCPGNDLDGNGAIHNVYAWTGTYWRTLGSHDEGEINQEYP